MHNKSTAAFMLLSVAGFAACDTPSEPTAEDLQVAQSVAAVDAAESFSDLAGTGAQVVASSSVASVEVLSGGDGLTVVANPGNVAIKSRRTLVETFEGTNSLFVDVCDRIDHFSNDLCYSGGEIEEFVAVDNLEGGNDPGGMVAIAPFALGLPTTVVGPNFFLDDASIEFKYNGASRAFFDLYAPFQGPCLMRLTVYGAGGSLGSFAIQSGAGAAPATYLVASETPMTNFTFEDLTPDFCGELIDNVVGVFRRR